MRTALTTRLVVTAVVLVVAVSSLIAVFTTVAMRGYLTSRLDDDVRRSVRIFAAQANPSQQPGQQSSTPPDQQPGPGFGGRYQPPGTLNAVIAGDQRTGVILGETPGSGTQLSDDTLDELADLPTDGTITGISVPDHGSFRVATRPVSLTTDSGVVQGTLVTGLPTTDVDDAVDSLVEWEVVLLLVGLVTAVAAGLIVVRRQLRPLRDVAATAHAVAAAPLSQGEIAPLERVPDKLTDDHTEVGQVGAALNTLVEHVEVSLAARHRSEQQVRQFVADASHELRTPLTTIRGYTELARSRPETIPTALAKVDEESTRMAALVEDLLLLARLDAGRPLADDVVDLTRLVIEAVADAQLLAPDHGWIVVAPDEPVEVRGDEARLHQVVTNLLTNARRYTPAGTQVTVTVTPGGFAVHDTGPGFPSGIDPFERFARGDASRHHDHQTGSGLGLALVRAIVTSHGGTVSLRSVPGDTAVEVRLGLPRLEP